MAFTKESFVSNLYKVSKSKKDNKAVMSSREQDKAVYDLDEVKDWFSNNYRNRVKMRSCDGFYQNERDELVLEFKNTNHLKFKEFMGEIEQKMTDTHMLLLETFYREGKVGKVAADVSLLVVYNDELSMGAGLNKISTAVNCMKPIQGSKSRKSKLPALYTEQEYEQETKKVIEKYRGTFYRDVNFMDKKDFCEMYVERGYFTSPLRG